MHDAAGARAGKDAYTDTHARGYVLAAPPTLPVLVIPPHSTITEMTRAQRQRQTVRQTMPTALSPRTPGASARGGDALQIQRGCERASSRGLGAYC